MRWIIEESVRKLLIEKAEKYESPHFIADDPIAIPHLFSQKEDIEIAGFFAAIFSWGLRKTIIAKSKQLMQMMDMSPFQFVMHSSESDLASLKTFVHRTFQYDDLYFFILALREIYAEFHSLENIFIHKKNKTIEAGINQAFELMFERKIQSERSKKHFSSPARNSSCKRINMYLRWMVRSNDKGVDFGIWKNISPSQLMIPLDIHVMNTAIGLGLVESTKTDWNQVVKLTSILKCIDNDDPIRFDFALFGMGIMEKYSKNT